MNISPLKALVLSAEQKKIAKKLKNFAEKFGSNKILRTFAIPNETNTFETIFPNSSVG